MIYFPGLSPTPEQHVALAKVFGELTRPSSVNPSIDGHPEITEFHTGEGAEEAGRSRGTGHRGGPFVNTGELGAGLNSTRTTVEKPPRPAYRPDYLIW